jgi:hypothetical protein
MTSAKVSSGASYRCHPVIGGYCLLPTISDLILRRTPSAAPLNGAGDSLRSIRRAFMGQYHPAALAQMIVFEEGA